MAFLILFAATWLGGYLFPWWWPALAAYAVGAWLPRRRSAAVISGFCGTAAAWAAAALWADLRNQHILSSRIAALFRLPGPAGAIGASALAAGLMGAAGAWAGYALKEWWRPGGTGPRAKDALPSEDGKAPLAAARNAAVAAAGSDNSGGTGPAAVPMDNGAGTRPVVDGTGAGTGPDAGAAPEPTGGAPEQSRSLAEPPRAAAEGKERGAPGASAAGSAGDPPAVPGAPGP